jgi:hypothetical protein
LLTSTTATLFGFGPGLDVIKSQHSSKPDALAVIFMRTFIFITSIFCLTLNNSFSAFGTRRNLLTAAEFPYSYSCDKDTAIKAYSSARKISVLIFPPYDFIANEGISPDTQKYLEEELSKDTSLTVIKFPYKKLMNVPYQNVFDKKYVKPVADKIKTDKIVMTKLDQVTHTGNMNTDKWNLRIRIYDTNTGKQMNSRLVINELTSGEIKKILSVRHNDLIAEIKNNR